MDDKIDNIMMSINGNGLFQYLAFFTIAGGVMAFNGIIYNLAFLEVLPQFTCSFNGSTELIPCVEKDFCGNPDVEVFVDWDDPNSIYNWASTIGLVCRPGW